MAAPVKNFLTETCFYGTINVYILITEEGKFEMLDIRFVKENPELVKDNIRKKFEDHKLPLVDEVIALYDKKRDITSQADMLRANRNKISKEIGALMGQGKKDEAEEKKRLVSSQAEELKQLAQQETELEGSIKEIMMKIPNIIDPSVPIGKNDTENVEVQRYGEPVVPDFEIPRRQSPTLTFRITWTLWKSFPALIKNLPAALQEKDFIT